MQDIIRYEPEQTFDARGRLVRSRKQQLMNLEGGRTWRWMLQNIYPFLRSAASVVCYYERVDESACPEGDTVEVVSIQSVETPADTYVCDELATFSAIPAGNVMSRPAVKADDMLQYPVAAFRSNLLVPFLNIGIEVPVSSNWTVGADYYYPWIWPKVSNKNCFELIFISAEARYWFNPSKGRELTDKNYLTGHSVAVYGAWGYYDIERNYHGHQGHGWSGGVDYVFALPIARDMLRLEFQLAVGVIWSPEAQPYNVFEDGGELIREPGHRKNFFYVGPTKVGVSLVLPINRQVKRSAPVMP